MTFSCRALGMGLALTFSVPDAAQAQQFSAERFRPATSREGIIDVEAPRASPHLTFDTALWLNYAYNPLVVQEVNASGNERAGALIAHRLSFSLVAAISFFDFLAVGAELPLVGYQTQSFDGNQLGLGDGITTAGLGDLRLVPKVQLLRSERHFIDIAVFASVTLPTSTSDSGFMGNSGPTATPELGIGRSFGGFRLAANVGYKVRQEASLLGLDVDDEITYRAGAAIQLPTRSPLEIAASVSGAVSIKNFDTTNSAMEVLLAAVYEPLSGLQMFIGPGVGIIAGHGTPDARAFAGFRYSPRPAPDTGPKDRDGDGIPDDVDGCPDDPEDFDGFEDEDGCPDPDNDGDGILDVDDRCPNQAEDFDGFEDEDGCPELDNDQDGIPDAQDACPNEPEDFDGFEDADGCPEPDNDGDGIADAQDKCPLEPEDFDGFEDADGCPEYDNDGDGIADEFDLCPNEPETINGVEDEDGCPDEGPSKVKLTADKIEITEKVYFDTGRSTIQRRSHDLLRQVASILRANPSVTRLRIEGHTDSRGSNQVNQRLSQDRAEAVMRFLIEQGIDPARLSAHGYGSTRAIAPNATARGREMNRRVEFVIEQPEVDN